MNNEELVNHLPHLFGHWGYALDKCRPELCITGSPERAVRREVLQATNGECFVIEAVPLAHRDARENQFRAQHFLVEHGVQGIYPWLTVTNGQCGLEHDGFFWQLRRYVTGEPLPRESYGNDGWRGRAAGEFLNAVGAIACSSAMPRGTAGQFLLKRYISALIPHIERRMPALVDDLKPILAELQEFFQQEESLKAIFCHGDFHPGNIVWGNQKINAVIDWEFLGFKAAAYDAANMLGCIGMDEPAYLTAPFAMEFIKVLRSGELLDDASWHFLPDLIAALRFAWLREWVAQKNKEMICQELDFIWLILDNRQLLRDRYTV